MMSSFEYSAKNVNKAIENACAELNLSPDEIKYDILSHGSSGIFGLAGVKKAKIRVHLPEKPKEPNTKNQPLTSDSELKDEIYSEENKSPDQFFADDNRDVPQPVEFEENPLDLGRTVLQRIVDAITNDAKISAEENSGGLFFNVVGGNAGILIGKKGQTLDAIQSLVEKIINKHNPHNDKIRVQVDVEGYLETRKANLEKLAERLAHKSKRIRKPISLGQMSAYDRRIVHLALKHDPDIRTKSKGEGYMRKLVIFPQKIRKQRQQMRSQ
ncbi:MAG: RNA-binding cell elongation regulator Jag/EloR [Desulfobacteraceae bacterium]|jgi:spoIIIJ-associated protein|nr:RNA-binding cell elongation regulator Jag/EloR [Desulfobacteraceae bacterium]